MFRLSALVVLLVVLLVAVTALPSSKLIGGEATIAEFPYLGAFYIWGNLICTVTIISEKVVVTAGHCILNMTSPEMCNVRVGSALSNEGGQYINVEWIYLHDKYYNFFKDYDIVLLVLRTPIVFNGVTVRPIRFAQSGEPQQGGVVGRVAGWKTGVEVDNQLRQVSLSIAEHELCEEVYADNERESQFTERMLCVLVDKENAACNNDKGSALIVDGVLVGIASWATECGNPEYPSVFTDVSIVSDWILKTLAIIG